VGYDVLQASFYDDPESSKSREIDVVARVTDFVGLLQRFLFVECKKRSKPWVIFSSESVGLMRARAFSLMSDKAFDAMISDPERFLGLEWFRKDGRIGFGVAEAFSDRGDETFQAGMTATKAAIDKRIKDAPPSESALSFYFPVIVLDGILFESFLDSSGNLQLQQIKSGFLHFPITVAGQHGTAIRIVTADALDEFCEQVHHVHGFLKESLRPEIKQAASELVDCNRRIASGETDSEARRAES
jgi:hypothetical protein